MKHFIVCFLFLLTGCVFHPVSHQNVSNNNKYPSDYIVDETYRAQPTLAVVKMDDDLTLCPQDDYPKKDFVGYIPSGTLLVFSKLELEKDMRMNEDVVWAWGRFSDGPFAGKRVQLYFISRDIYYPSVNARIPFVDTNLLKLANKP